MFGGLKKLSTTMTSYLFHRYFAAWSSAQKSRNQKIRRRKQCFWRFAPAWNNKNFLKFHAGANIVFGVLRRRICIFSSFCAELHADNLGWRNVGKVWPKVLKDTKWSYLTTLNLISCTVFTWSFGSCVHEMFKSQTRNQHYLSFILWESQRKNIKPYSSRDNC